MIDATRNKDQGLYIGEKVAKDFDPSLHFESIFRSVQISQDSPFSCLLFLLFSQHFTFLPSIFFCRPILPILPQASAKSIKISASSTPKPITPSSLPIDSSSTSTISPQNEPTTSNPNSLSGRLSLIAQAKRDHAKRVLMSGFVRGEIIGTKQEEEIISEKQKAKQNDVNEDEDEGEGEKKFGRGENLKEKRLREIEEAIKKKADQEKGQGKKRKREDGIDGKELKKLRKLEKKKEKELKMIRKEEKASRKLEKETKRLERERKRREKEAKKIKKKEIEVGDSSERKERKKRKIDDLDQDQVEVQETEPKSKSKSKSKSKFESKSKSSRSSSSKSAPDTSESNQDADAQFIDPKTLIGQKQESELFTPETTPPITSYVDAERRKKKRKKDKKIK